MYETAYKTAPHHSLNAYLLELGNFLRGVKSSQQTLMIFEEEGHLPGTLELIKSACEGAFPIENLIVIETKTATVVPSQTFVPVNNEHALQTGLAAVSQQLLALSIKLETLLSNSLCSKFALGGSVFGPVGTYYCGGLAAKTILNAMLALHSKGHHCPEFHFVKAILTQP